MDPLLILLIVLGAGAFFFLMQKKKQLANQARNSIHSMSDEGFEFRADEAGPTPTGKYRVEQMMRSTEGKFGAPPSPEERTLANPFEDEDE